MLPNHKCTGLRDTTLNSAEKLALGPKAISSSKPFGQEVNSPLCRQRLLILWFCLKSINVHFNHLWSQKLVNSLLQIPKHGWDLFYWCSNYSICFENILLFVVFNLTWYHILKWEMSLQFLKRNIQWRWSITLPFKRTKRAVIWGVLEE